MFKSLVNSPAWHLIFQADWMAKFILVSLFFVSVASIAIILFKYLFLREQKKRLNILFEKVKKIKNFQDILSVSKENSENFGGRFLIQNLNNLKLILEKDSNIDKKLSLADLEYLEIMADQYIEELILEGETYFTVLSTSGAVATLVGLFGTVWGLIHAFINISQEKSADIAVVAPGIAEALITTLAGLIVAIPALIGFYYLTNELRKLEIQLNHLSQLYGNILKQAFLK